MASHEVYNKDNKFLSKLRFKSKTLNILRNLVLSLVIILGLNWVVAITTDVNLLGTGLRKVFDAVEGYNHAIPSVEIASDDWASKAPGSWHIDKSAKWTGAKTAEVVFDLNTTKKYISEGIKFDVVMVLDVSTSMKGEKFDQLKVSAKKYFDEILADSGNKVGIVQFHTSASVLQGLTNNKTSLNNTINNLELHCEGEVIDGVKQDYGYCTNYYDGLKKAEDLLKNYVPSEKRQLVILLLTDGYANRDNQLIKNEYNNLKEKYPDSIINGIQYEMGSEINYYLTQASDEQYDATTENIYDKFFNATYAQKLSKFENFEVIDYIKDKYFKVNSASDISVNVGTIKLENGSNGSQKIIWTLSPDFRSGMSGKMKINLTLKDAYVKDVDKDFYPTNTGEDITWQLTGETKKTKKSTLTPVLQRIYNVTYENNPPQNCSISKTTIEKHYGYENVKIKDTNPTCAGYTFKGWEIITDGVKTVNENTFVMPEGNVTIRGQWGAQSISKSMQGQLYEKPTLYEIVKADAEQHHGASTYSGQVTDEVNNTVNTKIYYYTSDTYNNIIFGGFCWQIVRTTATGGVKMIYNGVPTDGKCNNSGSAQQLSTTSKFNSEGDSPAYAGYMYNTTVEPISRYDMKTEGVGMIFGKSVKKGSSGYTLQNTTTISDWRNDFDADTISNYHYTCLSKTSTTCAKVAYVYSTSFNGMKYIELDTYNSITELLNKMLSADDVNKTSSTIKQVIDGWYRNNMTSYTKYLEDTVFCNDRSIKSLGRFNPNGGITSEIGGKQEFLEFNNYNNIQSNYVCPRILDQFAMSNSKAKLTYPVGLLTAPEASKMGSTFRNTHANYYLATPSHIWDGPIIYYVNYDTIFNYTPGPIGVRPVVSLKPGIKHSSGAGTKDDPFIIKTN